MGQQLRSPRILVRSDIGMDSFPDKDSTALDNIRSSFWNSLTGDVYRHQSEREPEVVARTGITRLVRVGSISRHYGST